MFFNDGMGRDDVDISITNQNVNSNMNDNMNMNMNYNDMMDSYSMPMQPGSIMSPIIEPGRERIVNRTFVHEVPQE